LSGELLLVIGSRYMSIDTSPYTELVELVNLDKDTPVPEDCLDGLDSLPQKLAFMAGAGQLQGKHTYFPTRAKT
jgi:hypothetical protein